MSNKDILILSALTIDSKSHRMRQDTSKNIVGYIVSENIIWLPLKVSNLLQKVSNLKTVWLSYEGTWVLDYCRQ